MVAAVRRPWPPGGRLRRHRHGGHGAPTDHERVDHGPAADFGDVRCRNAGEPAPLLDLWRQLRDRDPETAARAHRARVRRGEWADVGKGAIVRDRGERIHTALESPDHLLVVAAGGPAGGFGAVIPPWMGSKTKAVTAAIGVCIDCGPPKA